MTTSAPPRPSRNSPAKTLWDLVFTLLIPIAILSPNILGSGVSVAALLGGGQSGNVRSYLIAALIPVVYVLWDILVRRNVSPVALLGGATALFAGALAFWYVDGFLYAIKDSARSYLTALFAFLSVLTAYPLFRIFLDAASLTESPQHRAATQVAMKAPQVARALAQATLLFGVVDLIGGVVNSVVNYRIVVAKFGTEAFNAQVAQANAVMRVPGIAISLIGAALAFWLVQRAMTARYGQGASLLEPEKLEARLREAGEL
ncbi:VC0807 family protein [Deinococcus sonorensis]|uniref:VC0807 family protein n=2 Tax=Deinococcus sonorensis TaxID=309891 RepID=A0AAU7UC97_9DEIO